MYQQFKMITQNSFQITVWDNPRYPTVITCIDIRANKFNIPNYLKDKTQKDTYITLNKICDVINGKLDIKSICYKKYEDIVQDVKREVKA